MSSQSQLRYDSLADVQHALDNTGGYRTPLGIHDGIVGYANFADVEVI